MDQYRRRRGDRQQRLVRGPGRLFPERRRERHSGHQRLQRQVQAEGLYPRHCADYKELIARTEFYRGDLSSIGEHDFAQSYAVGYRIGKFTPMFTYSRFFLKYSPESGLSREDEECHDIRAWSVRYDLTTSSALKLQYDIYHDRSGDNFRSGGSVAAGNARLITASYDMVF